MKKLLAIVDDWERLERYEEALHSLFHFHSSPFGNHGIELAVQENPDIILIDLEFEDMDEERAVSLIRSQESLVTKKLLVITNENSKLNPDSLTQIVTRPVAIKEILIRLKT